MNKQGLTPAPIDNKNILEDFADEIADSFDDGSVRRQTFWKNECLFLVDYTFGNHNGIIKCVYGYPTKDDILTLKEDLSEVMNIDDAPYCCDLFIKGSNINFAFYWKESI